LASAQENSRGGKGRGQLYREATGVKETGDLGREER